MPIQEVWAALTRPDRLSAWFGARAVEVELHQSGRITFEREGEYWRGLVETVDAPHGFSFRWLPGPGGGAEARTRVEFHLRETAFGTRLTVRETPLWDVADGSDAGALAIAEARR
ncbi:MAG TPA: SRPBCC domain-containing protein [Actinomycetota bacterium]